MHKGITYAFILIVLLLVVTHAPGFAESVTAVGGQSGGKSGGTGVLGAINTLSGASTAQVPGK